MKKRLIFNIGWIASPTDKLYNIDRIDADSILIEDEKISWIGNLSDISSSEDIDKIDARGMGVTPGLIDFHTHPVFAKTREAEFDLRTKGATYAEIAAAGGGILNSTKRVAEASEEDLYTNAKPFVNSALKHGTTTLEAKSGYGLNPENEYKLLKVIRELDKKLPMDLIPTFLGAHEFPLEYRENHEGYLKILTEEMIPTVAKEKLAEACDIFCETGVYSLEETRKILSCAKEYGLKIKVHADQLTPLGGTKLAAELGALSADHIEFIDEAGMDALLESGTVAGLLPVAAHFLRMKEDPPVRKMIEKGITCALATDFNPGSSMCENMQMALHLATIRFRVTAEEAFWMATMGSAKALDLYDRGEIQAGKLADLVLWDAASLEMLPYHFGVNQVDSVIKRGEVVVKGGKILG
jgi:imidazolonepropionase